MNFPFKLVSRAYKKDNTIININGTNIGDNNLPIIAGPCTIESKAQLLSTAKNCKDYGAAFLRGGAYKARTSPYSFQGLGKEALEYLYEAKKETGLPVVSELIDIDDLPYFDFVDIIQIGAKNMQNFSLLKKLGKCNKPILLKRGFSNTIEELLLSAEYIMESGNTNIILCERGIRTFEPYTRNTFDINAIPLLKKLSHLPVIADPSHGTGLSELVLPISLAAVSAGADGLIIEIHDSPSCALCDGRQAITSLEFKNLSQAVKAISPFAYKQKF